MKPPEPVAAGLSIGALARAVGVPVETLRTWEARYGYPTPERRPSGHRRYPLDAVERLRLVARLLERGHRPSSVVPVGIDDLRALLALAQDAPSLERPEPRAAGAGGHDAWFDVLDKMDVTAFEALLQEGWNAQGGVGFLERDLTPFLVEVGLRWREGRLDVAREHLASAVVAQFLARQWRAMSDVARGPLALCATLPGEQHVLGLHMAAVALAQAGWRIRFLGADTPVEAIAGAARALAPDAVAISVSAAADAERVRAEVARLAEALPPGTRLWGGGTPPPGEDESRWPGTLSDLVAAARSVARGSR